VGKGGTMNEQPVNLPRPNSAKSSVIDVVKGIACLIFGILAAYLMSRTTVFLNCVDYLQIKYSVPEAGLLAALILGLFISSLLMIFFFLCGHRKKMNKDG